MVDSDSARAFQDSRRAFCRVEALGAEFGSLAVGHRAYMSDLPGAVVEIVAGYSDRGHLGEASKTTRAIVPVKYKIDASETKHFFYNDPDGLKAAHHMGLDPRGTKLLPRAVKTIVITGCYEMTDTDIVCISQEKAFARVIAHAIPTLSSIALEGTSRAANKFVSALLAALVGSGRPAPCLLRVKLSQSPNSVNKALNAIMQGLWPALQVLEFPQGHANRAKMTRLATAVWEGKLRDLRVLNWDNQSEGGRKATNLILEALAMGGCPEMEVLSFTNNSRFDRMSLSFLGSAIQACQKLREIHMDCTVDPGDQLEQLTNAITSGYAPTLEVICVQLKKGIPRSVAEVAVQKGIALEEAGESRLPTPVKVKISVAKYRG